MPAQALPGPNSDAAGTANRQAGGRNRWPRKRDALSQPGVKAVILLEGINDIGFSAEPDTGRFAPNDSTITAAHIEAGYLQLIKMAPRWWRQDLRWDGRAFPRLQLSPRRQFRYSPG